MLKKKLEKQKIDTQYNLFNPELFLTISKINKRFGKDAVYFGNEQKKTNDAQHKILASKNIEVLNKEANKTLKSYQDIDRELINLSKAMKTNANIRKRKQLEKYKEKVKSLYVSIRKRINEIVN